MSGITDNQDHGLFIVLLNIRDFDFNGFCMMTLNLKFPIVNKELSFLEIVLFDDVFETVDQFFETACSLKVRQEISFIVAILSVCRDVYLKE